MLQIDRNAFSNLIHACELQDGWTPLHVAARNGHLEVVNLLLDHGANTEAAETVGSFTIGWRWAVSWPCKRMLGEGIDRNACPSSHVCTACRMGSGLCTVQLITVTWRWCACCWTGVLTRRHLKRRVNLQCCSLMNGYG